MRRRKRRSGRRMSRSGTRRGSRRRLRMKRGSGAKRSEMKLNRGSGIRDEGETRMERILSGKKRKRISGERRRKGVIMFQGENGLLLIPRGSRRRIR